MSARRRRLHPGFLSSVVVLMGLGAASGGATAQTFTASETIAVGPTSPTDVSRLVDGGVVSLEGTGTVIVTVAGEMKARADRDGVIGVFFLPDLPFFDALYRNRRILLATSEFTAPIAAGESSFFVSRSKRVDAGFPRYRLLLYNTTGAAASVNVYVGGVKN